MAPKLQYNNNLNYPDYGTYSPSQYTPTSVMPAAPMNSMQNFLSYAAPATSILGTVASTYGAYKANEMQEKQYDEQKRQFELEQERLRREEEERKRQTELNNIIGFGNYATGQAQNAESSYGGYARRVGL